MQLKVFINLNSELILPINYNHILQGIIYHALSYSDKDFTRKIHDTGINNSSNINSNFKLFSFSKIIGKYRVLNKKIIFYDKIFFEIRSVDSYFIHLVYEGLSKNGIPFKDAVYKADLKISDKIITDSEIYIQTLSPIVAIQKEYDNKKSYLSPMDNNFVPYLNNNFIKKYTSYYNNAPMSDLDVVTADVTYKDKCITLFKNTYIVAWNGRFYLNSEPEYLTFLYNVGLGSKNSQGFGLFNVIDG